jgi:hypothetical protein
VNPVIAKVWANVGATAAPSGADRHRRFQSFPRVREELVFSVMANSHPNFRHEGGNLCIRRIKPHGCDDCFLPDADMHASVGLPKG